MEVCGSKDETPHPLRLSLTLGAVASGAMGMLLAGGVQYAATCTRKRPGMVELSWRSCSSV